ncbi:LamG-like jellyroll fold domain-containing protein [Kitasatospora sp. NPDC088346]|uniref:LamG-like jellyroll fold domain-containing protein n=1 Tax=Kitasatospora sp. NPDC088346 TaxID=3364073 RepID=UPI00380089CB
MTQRGERQRTFQNANGTFTTRYYPTPVNFRRADGSWAAIDTSLVPAGRASLGRAAPTQDGWTTTSGEREVKLAAAADGDPLVTLDLGDGAFVAYGVQGAAHVQGNVEGSTVTYSAVLPKADLSLQAGSDSFKETLVLGDASAPAEWVFPMRLKGVSASVDAGGALVFTDAAGAVRGRMPSGWMEDSRQAPNSGGQGVVSGGVRYELVQAGGGQALRMVLDEAWLKAPERVFPVKVDPSVYSAKAVQGTYVMSGVNADFSSDSLLKVGTYDGGSSKAASFLKFTGVENTLRNATVLGVNLALYNNWSASCNARPVTVHPITSDWSQGSVRTWPGPSVGSALVSDSFAYGWRPGTGNWVCAPNWRSINLGEAGRNLVNSWTHGWQANYGLAVKADDRDSNAWKKFDSENNSTTAPSLDVTWSKYGADYALDGWVQPVTATQEGIFRIRAWNRGQETWTPGNSYKMSYLLFDQWGNNITNYGTNIAWTSVPADVPPGGGTTFDAHIRSLPQGTYTVAWTMDDYQHSNFYMDNGIAPPTIRFSSVNMPPVLTKLAPPSHSVVQQLQPTLTAQGTDPDRSPRPTVDYRFEVCRVAGEDARVGCQQSAWQPSSAFVVPEGWLNWNEQYAWYAEAGDGESASAKSQPSYLRTLLPQPAQYSTAADAGRDFNAAVGNYTNAATDAALPTVGPELSVTRSFNSLDPRVDGAFGAGWTSRWDMRIQVESSSWLSLPGNVVLTASNGSRARFAWDTAKSAYIAGSGMAADLRKADGGGWTLTDRTGTVHTFDSSGHLVKVTDGAGHAQELTYSGGRLSRAKDLLSGRYLDFAWTGAHVTSVTASGATGSWSYLYTGDRLAKVCPPGVATTADKGCTAYEYGTGSRYQSAVQDAAPIGYWRLGESEGSAAANNARVTDRAPAQTVDVTWGADGPLGGSADKAASFNGRSSYLELPTRTISGSTQRSVELWFKTAGPGVILTYQNQAMAEPPNNVVPTVYVDANGKLNGQFNGSGGIITSAGTVNDDAWHHVLLSSAQTSTALYLDGQKVGVTSGAINHLDMDRTYLGGGFLGTWQNGAMTWFNGQIDEVAVYDYPVTDQVAAEHFALRGGTAQLTKVVLPSGRTSAQVGYDATSDRVNSVKDGAANEWKVSAPGYTGGSFLYNNAVTANGPAAYWRLGERDGAVAVSETGTGLAGGYGDGVTRLAPGVFSPTDDTAARFDGSARAQVELPESVLHASKDLAVELWFNTTKPGVLLGDQSRAVDDPAGPTGTWTPILYVGSDNKLWGRFFGAAGSTASPGSVADGTWHHVVLSVAGTQQTLYLDGTQVGVQSGAVDHQQNVHTYLGAGFAQGWPSGPADVSHFTGTIDEAAVYQHPLTAADALAHYRARSAQVAGQGIGYRGSVVADAPAGFWRADETSGTTAASEVAGIKGNGTYSAGVQIGKEGVFGVGDGRAAQFTGSADSYLDLPTPILQSGTEIAAELWFRTAGPGVLLSLQSEPMGSPPYNVVPALYVGSDGKLRGMFYGASANQPIASGGLVTDNTWHHAVLSAAGGTQSLYLDGALVGTVTGTVNHLNMNRTYLGGGYTGSMPGGNGGSSWLNGQIDEVAFYQHPLTAERAAAHHQARSLSSATALASKVTVTDPAGGVSTDVHDAQRGMRLISRTDTTGATTTYAYDTGGFLHTVIDPNGHSTITGQDARGNTVSQTTCRDANSCWTSYTSYYLNKDNAKDPRNDKPTETRDARSSGPADNRYRTTIGYTALGLPETTTLADGRTTRTTYTAGTEPATGGGITPAGLVATQATASGATTVYAYFASGDLASTTAPSGLRTTYGYDAMGRKTTETQFSDAQPGGVSTVIEYDSLSRETAVTGVRTTDPVSGTAHQAKTTRGFDEDGRLLSSTVADLVGGDTARTTGTTYDPLGRTATTTDAEGGVTTYGYDALSRTTSVSDPLGQITRFTYTPRGQLATTLVEGWNGDGQAPRTLTAESRAYDPAGRLASVTDAMGSTTAYTYFDDGLTATVTAQSVTQADGTAHPIVLQRNEYDGAGHLTRQTAGGGRTTTEFTVDATGRTTRTVLDPGGLDRTTTVGYDADDRVTSTTSKVSATENQVATAVYDTAGRQTRSELTSSAGGPTARTTYGYDQRGLVTTSTSPNGNAPGADPAAYTTTYQYDQLGRLTSTVLPTVQAESAGAAPAAVHPTATRGYNTFGEPVTNKDALGKVTTATTDRLGRVTETRLPDYTPPGATTALTAVARTEYDKLSRVTASSDAAGRKTTFGYDRLGHQTQRIDPNSIGSLQPPIDGNPPTWASTWTPTGLQLSVTNPVGGRTEATYDELGRNLTATLVERKPTLQNLTARTTWDDAGNQTAQSSAGGSTTTATHNTAGQPVTTTDPAGRTSKLDYDALGRTVKTTAPLGEAATIGYDALGNPNRTTDLDPAGTALRTRESGYDLEGRPLTTKSPATGATTTLTYDALGRLAARAEPVAPGQSITTAFGYDAAGNRTRLTDGRGNTTTYTFTPWGLPESTVEPATTAHPAAADRTWTTGYDVAGQAVKLTEPGGIVRTRTFDPMGRLTKETGTGAEAATDNRTLRYDKAGRLVAANGAGSSSQDFTYNDRDQLIEATVSGIDQSWEYDKDGRMTDRWDSSTGWATFGYKADGRLAWSEDQLTGSQLWYGYDGDGRLKTQNYVTRDPAAPATWKTTSSRYLTYDTLGRLATDTLAQEDTQGTPVTGTAYEYDLDDRLTRKTITGKPGDPADDNTYTYDQANRLTSWTSGIGTTPYEWDAAGNRTRNGQGVSTYDQRNRLLADGTSTYRYTARGTLAATTTAGTEQTQKYDAFDRLTNDGQTTYTYDGLDRMTKRGNTTFSYDGGTNNLITDGTWRYARDASGTVTGAADAAGPKRIRTDQHTDVTATLNTAGTAVGSSTTYDPFGKPVTRTGTNASLGYQSGWTDPANGDVNMHARWYQPGTGSFTSRDSWQLDPSGDSMQANRYLYSGGDPLNRTDPAGHFAPSPGGSRNLAPGPYMQGKTIPAPGLGQILAGGFRVARRSGVGTALQVFLNGVSSTMYQEKTCVSNPELCPELKPWEKNQYYGYIHFDGRVPNTTPDNPEPGICKANCTPTCKVNCGATCRVDCGTRNPVRPDNPNRPPVDPRPNQDRAKPLPDWTAPNFAKLLETITKTYGVEELLQLLTGSAASLTPNQAAQTHNAPGANPGGGTRTGSPRSCLDRRPATAENDSKDGTQGWGWINYWDMEQVEGTTQDRPTGAEACLTGTPSGSRGTHASGNITGWQEARDIAENAGFDLDSNPLARCHFIAREFGGSGTNAKNLAPCWQRGTNTGELNSMREFEIHVGDAMRDGQVVDYTVIPVYDTSRSKIPLGFSMMAYGQYSDGSPGMMEYSWVENSKYAPGTRNIVELGR